MSGFEGVLVVIFVLVVGAVFACIALSYVKVQELPTGTKVKIEEPQVADRQGSGSHRQAA